MPHPAAARPLTDDAGRPSFDHRLGSQQYLRLDREPKRLGGPEIDDRVELSRLLDRELGRLGALEDPVHEARRSPPDIREVDTEAEETAGVGILPEAHTR